MIRQRGKGELRMDSGRQGVRSENFLLLGGRVLSFFHTTHASNVTSLFNKSSYQPAEKESRATIHISTPREPI